MIQLLVVDDELHSVDSLADTIDWASIGIGHVYKAYSAIEALEILKEGSIDIVITDIHMPIMDGLELIEEIRKVWPRTKSVILSEYAEFEFVKKAIELQASHYLLKPVLNEEVMEIVRELVGQIQSEWQEISSREQATRAIRENLPLLRGNLLKEMIGGRQYPREVWKRKLEIAQVPFAYGDRYCLFMIRLEEGFHSFDPGSAHLLEYAVYNIVEEILSKSFNVWHCKDDYDYHVFLLGWKWNEEECKRFPSGFYVTEDEYLDTLFSRIQHKVKVFLKGEASILADHWERFPDRLSAIYLRMLDVYRQKIGKDSKYYMKLADYKGERSTLSLPALYEPPKLSQLLETGRWQEAEWKLRAIFQQINESEYESRDNLIEVFFHIYNAFICILHRNGRKISDFLGSDLDDLIDVNYYRNTNQLMDRSFRILHMLRDDSLSQLKRNRNQIVHNVQRYIEQHLAEDVSLQTLAEQVYLHPAYLSKVYKLETGEGINNYVQRIRMEKAVQMLKHTEHKIYEIGMRVGLSNATYFIKQFRKDYGMTPQEFRDALKG